MHINITGFAQTKFGEHYNKSLQDLILEATKDLDLSNLDQIFVGNMLAISTQGQGHLNSLVAETLQTNIPIFSIESACASGGFAVHLATQALKSSDAKKVLVIGAEKMTDQPSCQINKLLMQAGSEQERQAGLSFIEAYAFMAKEYADQFGLSKSDLNQISIQMHANACSNPKAQFPRAITQEQIDQAPLIAEPFTMYDCSPITDGAAAIILEAEKAPGIEIQQTAIATDAPAFYSRPVTHHIPATQIAAKKLDFNPRDIDVAELHDCFTFTLIMALEDIGFAPQGQAAKNFSSLKTAINPSGGLKACGHPVGATGVKQVAEIAKQLADNPSYKTGITHNVGGTGGSCFMSLITKS
jgi:acetyl-CoA C-acetyltransferase